MNRVVFCFSELHNMYIDKYGLLTYLHNPLVLFNYNECNQHFYVNSLAVQCKTSSTITKHYYISNKARSLFIFMILVIHLTTLISESRLPCT